MKYLMLFFVGSLLLTCSSNSEILPKKNNEAKKDKSLPSLREPLIGESKDLQDTKISGFPDPYPFKWGDYYYLFHSVVDFNNARIYRTKTFEEDDLTEFLLKFDHKSMPKVKQVWGFHPYRHTDGSYHAYGSVHYGDFKTEVAHFVPTDGAKWGQVAPIQTWKLKSILVGEQEIGAKVAYDGTIFRDDGTMYLVDNEQIDGENYIIARRMLNPDTIDSTFKRRILLGPKNYRSEDPPSFSPRITEGSFIKKIERKYVLIYSVSFFGDASYKIGAAFSNAMPPPVGKRFQRMLIDDPNNVWENNGATGGKEVKYLLQTEKEDWPNYVGEYVNGPGIGSLVNLDDGENLLIFAARPAGSAKHDGSGRYLWKVPVEYNFQNSKMSDWIKVKWKINE